MASISAPPPRSGFRLDGAPPRAAAEVEGALRRAMTVKEGTGGGCRSACDPRARTRRAPIQAWVRKLAASTAVSCEGIRRV